MLGLYRYLLVIACVCEGKGGGESANIERTQHGIGKSSTRLIALKRLATGQRQQYRNKVKGERSFETADI